VAGAINATLTNYTRVYSLVTHKRGLNLAETIIRRGVDYIHARLIRGSSPLAIR
jgi:hypothetical protein